MNPTDPPRPDPPGLQSERTTLAWERTVLAVLGSGALLALRHVHATGPPVLLAATLGSAALAVVLAIGIAALATHRARQVRVLAAVRPAWRAVPLTGAATVLLGVVVAGTLVLDAVLGH